MADSNPIAKGILQELLTSVKTLQIDDIVATLKCHTILLAEKFSHATLPQKQSLKRQQSGNELDLSVD